MKIIHFFGLIIFIETSLAASLENPSPSPKGNYVSSTDDRILPGISTKENVININLSRRKIRDVFAGDESPHDLSSVGNFSEVTDVEALNALDKNGIIQRGALFGSTPSTLIYVKNLTAISAGAFEDPSILVEYVEFKERTDATIAEHVLYLKGFITNIENAPIFPDFFKLKLVKTYDGTLEYVQEKEAKSLSRVPSDVEFDYYTRNLLLNNLGLKKFESGWFRLTRIVKGIEFHSNLITDITSAMLNGLSESVVTIDLQFNNINTIKRNCIDNKWIKTLILGNNPISKIEDNAFEMTNIISFDFINTHLKDFSFIKTLPKSVEEIRLNFNDITEIPVDTFTGLENLKTIDLSNNNLKELKPKTFKSNENLVRLLLNNNKFKQLDSEMFRNLKRVKIIMLSNNQIEKLSRNTFLEIRHPNLEEIYLRNNEINTVEDGSFYGVNVTTIDLSRNKLSGESFAKDAFDGCRFKELILDDNLMKKISFQALSAISEPFRLSLEGNQIENIEKGDAKNLGKLHRLHLARNPIKELKNGAFYGLSKDEDVMVYLNQLPIHSIPGGLFDDV